MPPLPDEVATTSDPEHAIDSGRTSALAGAGIFLSRIFGLVREIAINGFLGAGGVADAFRAATRIPNLLQNLLGEGTLSAAFIPVYSKLVAEGDEEQAGRLAGAVFGLLAVLSGILVVVGVTMADQLTTLVAWGLPPDTRDLTVSLVQITTVGVGFLVLSAWCLGVLNTHRRFFLSYVAPVVWNCAQIAAMVAVFAATRGEPAGERTEAIAVGLAWGMTIGGLLQFVIQLPTVVRVSGRIRPSLDVRHPAVKRVLTRFGPAVVGRGAVAISSYLELVLASFLAAGGLALLTSAQALYLLPIGLFALSVSAAELPELSRSDPEEFQGRLTKALSRMQFFVLFTLVVYLCGGRMIVELLFQRGQFTAEDTVAIWAILAAYCLGLLAVTSSRLVQSTLFALGDTKGPAMIVIVRDVVGGVLAVALMFQFDRLVVTPTGIEGWNLLPAPIEPLPDAVRDLDGPPHLGAVGIALAASVGNWIEYGLLRLRMHRHHLGAEVPRLAPVLLRLALPATAAAAIAACGTALGGTVSVWLVGPVALGLAGVAYVLLAKARGNPQAEGLVAAARRRVPHR